jgi:hypothetical protein
MPAALLSQRALGRILGTARVLRMIRAGWLKPVEHNASATLFDPRDVRTALKRMECSFEVG